MALWDKIAWYNDSQLNILEVPHQFPTGFFMQEVSSIKTVKITGACKINHEIRRAIRAIEEAVEERN